MGHEVLYVLRTQESLNKSVWDKDPLLEQPSPSISPSSAIATAQLASAAGLGALQCCWKHMVLCFLLEDLPDPTLVAASSGCGEEHCWTPLLALLSSIPALSAASPCGLWALGPLRTKPCAGAPSVYLTAFIRALNPNRVPPGDPTDQTPTLSNPDKGAGASGWAPCPRNQGGQGEVSLHFPSPGFGCVTSAASHTLPVGIPPLPGSAQPLLNLARYTEAPGGTENLRALLCFALHSREGAAEGTAGSCRDPHSLGFVPRLMALGSGSEENPHLVAGGVPVPPVLPAPSERGEHPLGYFGLCELLPSVPSPGCTAQGGLFAGAAASPFSAGLAKLAVCW